MKKIRRRSDLHGYQERMVQWIKDNPKNALWAGVGLGKTVTTLTALKELKEAGIIHHILVVAPLRVSKSVWPRESASWEHLQGFTCERLYWADAPENKAYQKEWKMVLGYRPPEKQKRKIFRKFYKRWLTRIIKKKPDFFVTNKENIFDMVDVLRKGWGFDAVVLDESTAYKRKGAKKSKAIKFISHKIKHLIELSAYPAPNGLKDLWTQIYLLDNGVRLGRTLTNFYNKYFDQSYDGYGYTPKAGADEEIYKALYDICITLSNKDYLDLPPVIENRIYIDLPEKALAQYKELEKNFILILENVIIQPTQQAVMLNKLLQFCSGAVYSDGGRKYLNDKQIFVMQTITKKWVYIHDAKLEALEDIIEESAGEPIIVAYYYKHDLERLKERFPKGRTFDSDDVEDDWNAGKIPLLFAQPQSVGHGLNLQYGGHILVWFSLTWDLELYDQMIGRLDRQGQTKNVVVHHLLVRDSIEDNVLMPKLAGKKFTQDDLLNAMKRKEK